MGGEKVRFQKKINNNVAWLRAEDGEKIIAIGNGISYGKTVGQKVRLEDIERIFKSETMNETQQNSINRLIENLSSDILILAEEISQQAADSLGIPKLDDSHFLALADHLNYAVKRSGETYDYPETLRWEVQKMYPKEFEAAIDSLYLIEKKTGIRLPRSEQTFLTYHFVNAQYDTGKNVQTALLTELINRSIELIQYHYQVMLDQNSVNYIRFVTHLRYFILRQMHQNEKGTTVDAQLIEIVQKNYRKANQVAEKVGRMLENNVNRPVKDEELFYLTLHIERVTTKD